MQLMENPVHALMQKTTIVNNVHPAGLNIVFDVGFHADCAWVGSAALVCGVLRVNEASYWEAQCVCQTCSYAIVISQGGGAHPLNFFGL